MKEIDLTARSHESLKERLTPVALALRGGGLVIVPTMTYYALSGDALNPDVVKRVFAAKQRDPDKPLLVLVDSFEMIKPLVQRIPLVVRDLEWRLGKKGLTYVLRAAARVPDALTAGTGRVGVRIERNEVVQELLGIAGIPITGTSANTGGGPPSKNVDEALASLRDWVDAAVRWWPSTSQSPTTIVDVTGPDVELLRVGTVQEDEIRAVLAG